MRLQALPGTPLAIISPAMGSILPPTSNVNTFVDAVNEAAIFIGHIATADGGSHTIDTTGASSLSWRSATTTFSNAATTVKVGLAAVDLTAGPPARAVNAANVITFDVSKSLPGNGGGILNTSWHTHVPDTGSKTIANGDLVAFAVQMTARGGTDSVGVVSAPVDAGFALPTVTNYTSAAYTLAASVPNCVISFNDGTIGYFYGGDVYSTRAQRTWNSGSSPNNYGQLYKMPFPMRVHGLVTWPIQSSATSDLMGVLLSDPLGDPPVEERAIFLDGNVTPNTTGRRAVMLFSSPYDVAANQPIAALFYPMGVGNVGLPYKTLAANYHRPTDPWGMSGYGCVRTGGGNPVTNANNSLDHYYIGLLVGAFDFGARATYSLGM